MGIGRLGDCSFESCLYCETRAQAACTAAFSSFHSLFIQKVNMLINVFDCFMTGDIKYF